MDASPDYLIKLAHNLETGFSTEDLVGICFKLGIDYENLAVPELHGKRSTAIALVKYLQQRGRVTELTEIGLQDRPNLDWADSAGTNTKVSATATVATLYSDPDSLSTPRQLFGREMLLAETSASLHTFKRVMLTGLGGMGKTSLALTIAKAFLVEGKGPLIWVNAKHAQIADLIEAIAECLDKKLAVASGSEEGRLTKLHDILVQSKTGLLMFDNVWNPAALSEVLNVIPENMCVLATSRLRYPMDKTIVVGELASADALKLLCDRAGRDLTSNPDARLDALALCDLLGNQAYALRIAGAILQSAQYHTPRTLLQRNAQAPHRLKATWKEDERPDFLLDASFDMLDAVARRVFIAFGGFSHPEVSVGLLTCTLELDHIQPDALSEALEDLAYFNLVELPQELKGLIRLHDLTFSYAQEWFRLSEHDPKRVIDAVETYVFQHLQDHGQIEMDMSHILSAADGADGMTLVRLMSAVAVGGFPRPNGPSYLDQRGHTLGLLERLDRAIAMTQTMGPEMRETLHYLLCKRGNAYAERGEPQKAAELYQASLALAPTDGRKAIVLAALGTMLSEQAHHEQAEAYLNKAYELAKTIGDDSALSFVLEQQSYCAGQRGDHLTVQRLAPKIIALSSQEIGPNPIRLGFALMNWGMAEKYLGNVAKSLELHEQALALAQQHEDQKLEASSTYSIAEDQHALEHRELAQKYLQTALELSKKIGDVDLVAKITQFIEENGYLSAVIASAAG